MESKIQEKIKIINKNNDDDARFIIKVLKAEIKLQEEFKKNKEISDIVIKDDSLNNKKESNNSIIIDLDNIWVKPYFYTKMRVRLNELVNQVLIADNNDILNHNVKFYRRAIYNKAEKKFEKPENEIDIVDFIKKINIDQLEDSKKLIFLANKIDEETIFKERYIKKAIQIIKVKDIRKRYSIIYDEICEYLDKDFLQNEYCDFKGNKCIAQRRHKLYPPCKKNGCCFMEIRKCPNLKDGKCMIECISCKLFSCKYLEKRGIGYWGREIIFLQAFFNKKQRKHIVFDFYQSKEKILNKLYLSIDK